MHIECPIWISYTFTHLSSQSMNKYMTTQSTKTSWTFLSVLIQRKKIWEQLTIHLTLFPNYSQYTVIPTILEH